ncbi:MAG: twin-arginine translocase TatA/TatE family subunit [Candidatus Dormibacteria bacterium]
MERLWWLIPAVLLIVLLFGGANKLPEIGAGMGRAIREFRNAMAGTPDPGAPGAVPPAAGPAVGYDPLRQWAPAPETRPPATVPDDTLRG